VVVPASSGGEPLLRRWRLPAIGGPMWTCSRLAPIASYSYDKAGWLTGTATGAVASSSAAHPWDADQEAMADAVLGQARAQGPRPGHRWGTVTLSYERHAA
jgi:hypothetical protein